MSRVTHSEPGLPMVQDDENSYHDSLKAHLMEGIGHSCQDLKDLPQDPSSNHRLESAGLNAREQLLFIGNREDGNAWQKIGVTFDSHQVKLAN